MALRIGINGFGRIGRLVLRVAAQENMSDIKFVGINDLIPPETMAHLLKYDSTHGRFDAEVQAQEGMLKVNGKDIRVTSERDPAAIPWKDLKADIILECTGLFTNREAASKHLTAGAKKVIISAPAKDVDTPTFVFGINHENYDPHEHTVVSNASCTTNCLAPLIKALNDAFVVEQGFMTTIHSYTNDQRVVDGPHKDLRRARAAAVSQIPTTTGAAKAVGKVLPELEGKLDGFAVRVPTANVSCVDLVAICKNDITAESVNAAFKKASEKELKGVLGYCDEPLVSVDFMGTLTPSIVDAKSTRVIGNMVKALSWYDNEAGFCHQMLHFAKYMGKKL
jgi:glyceraldehyde 3-phosphate dehydrogenase